MSGTSRIGGYGGGSGSSRQRDRSVALTRFCRGRKAGDVVSGTFVRMETESLGLAILEGEELFAQIPAELVAKGAVPAPGERVFFRIEALVPEVVLRMLSAADPSVRLASILPSVPLAQEIVLYVASRDKLDSFFAAPAVRDAVFSLPDAASRKAAFIRCIAGEPAMLGAFAETLARSHALCRAVSCAGLMFFRHMPWLSGAVSQIEVSFWSRGESPVFAGARLHSGDRLLLRGAMEDGRLRYRLAVSGTATAKPRFSSVHTVFAEYRGVEPQSRSNTPAGAADLISRILALAADSGTMAVGRFSRKL